MNTAQNYAGKGCFATQTQQTAQNEAQPATQPIYRRPRPRTPRQRQYDALHQTLGSLTTEQVGSDYCEMLGDMLESWLKETTKISDQGQDAVYELSAFHMDRIWATTRLMTHLVKLDEVWGAIQRTKNTATSR